MRRRLYTLLCIVAGMLLSEVSYGQLIANFTSNTTGGCSPILVQFTDQSTGNPTSWLWNLGNGTTSTLQNPSSTYITPGLYTVTLTVSSGPSSNTKTLTSYINVLPAPFANFVVSDSTLSCPPKTVQFTNLSIPGSTGSATYLWDFGDGTTSTASNPSHTYTTGGNYNVSLSVTNSSGCLKIKSKAQYVLVSQKPAPDFTALNNNSCSLPTTVVFTNTTIGAVSYLWDFGNGNTSTAANPTQTYVSGGSYTVRLIATNANGCKDTITKPGFVNIGPLVASFSKSSTSTCVGSSVFFTNTTTPGAGNSTWYFGDGTSATTANPSKAYTTPGTYTVKLVVNYNNCSDSTTQTIVVHPSPSAQFSATPTDWCSAPKAVQFTNLSIGASTYNWNFGNGSTAISANPTHTYTSLGSYTVTLVATSINGCKDTLVQPAYVNLVKPEVTLSFTPANSCAPSTVTLTANVVSNQPITSYFWDYGDGTSGPGGATVSHLYPNGYVTYFPKVIVNTASGCSDTSALVVLPIGAPVTAGFTATPTTICPGQTVFFTNTTTFSAGNPLYYWTFGDGSTSTLPNPSHTYTNQGVYTVTLFADNNGCTSMFTMQITVNPPFANFTPNYSCSDRKKVTFTNTSTGGTFISWDFGDGTTSSQTNPNHTYTNFGTYDVQLLVVNGPTGCTASITKKIVLFPIDAQFIADDTTVCKGVPVNFTAAPDSNIINYNWNFGDGSSFASTSNVVPHSYSSSGVYDVRLIITDFRNCKDTIIKLAYIKVNGPTVNFSGAPTSGCIPLTVNFTDQTVSPDGFAIRAWRFMPASPWTIVTGANTSFTYTSAGNYTVRLAVTDNNGCTDTMVKPAYINITKPVADFTTGDTVICKGATAQFANTSVGSNLTYLWSFGDGSTATATNPAHVYSNPGVYTVRLIATNSSGCKDTVTKTSYVKVNGVLPGFTVSDTIATCPPITVNFTDTSVGATNTWWSFGNGNISTFQNPTTVYTQSGTYTVTQYGQSGGCVDSALQTITVLGPSGTLSYSPVSGCLPLTVNFTSTNTNTQVLIWDMNNGVTQTTTGSTTTYTYTQPGAYVPVLLLSDGVSCIVPVVGSDTIRVGNIVADFSILNNNLCQAGTVNFADTILTPGVVAGSRIWTFGDGGTSTAHNPSHTYTAPGTYTVTLIIGSSAGCTDTLVKTVTILTPPSVNAGNAQSICAGLTTGVQLQASGAATYIWSPANTLSCTSCSNPVASPVSTTTYTVVGTSANGCQDTSQVTVTVNPIPAITTGPPVTICEGSSVQLAAAGAVSYSWSPAGTLSCTGCSNPTATPLTTTTYTITGTSAAGCTSTAQILVNVTPNPVISAIADQPQVCAGTTVQLQASGALTYSWIPATGLSCSTCPNPTVSPLSSTTYIVSGINAQGCTDTASVTVTVNSSPAVSAGPNQAICAGGAAQLQATGAATYTWSPATGLSCSGCPNPIANPAATSTYTVTGTSLDGCISTSQVTVTVNPIPTVVPGANQTICSGSSAQLNASGTQNYSWTPATGLSCTNCPNPTASPVSTTVYTVTGTDANGCSDTAQITITVNPLPGVNAGQDVAICRLDEVQLLASGAVSYSWTPAVSLSCNTCENPMASPAATTIYQVTGTDANGCSSTDAVTVTLFPDAQINAGADQIICAGSSVQLNASGAVNYIWSPVTGLSCTGCPDPFASPSTDITYFVSGTDINGCNDSDFVKITVIQKEPMSFGPDQAICEGGSVQLNASGGDSYQWVPATGLNNTQISGPVATPTTTVEYTVIIKQGICFADSGKVRVEVYPLPTVHAGGDQTVLAGSSVNLFAMTTHTDNYLWSPVDDLSCSSCQSPVATPKRTTTYTVNVSNNFGCEAKDDVTIFIKCDNSQVFMANTFTPNSDGANDRFFPQGKGLSNIQRFRVFNRWGEIVFDASNIEVNNATQGWDGTFKGEPLKPDVFVYIVDATCETGEPMQIKGDISLIR